ncbi:hypothetical protein B0H15DRAFT_949685 [Mycena belliarum]|uniref:Uncharacterized protein n=1 Tax=Mycena belliarum TaxID=1033014 RepID=A0AAD6U824_9AGAR|nr:hypothetical protein B0H15DRAFT_949685 [Mycena belliae]
MLPTPFPLRPLCALPARITVSSRRRLDLRRLPHAPTALAHHPEHLLSTSRFRSVLSRSPRACLCSRHASQLRHRPDERSAGPLQTDGHTAPLPRPADLAVPLSASRFPPNDRPLRPPARQRPRRRCLGSVRYREAAAALQYPHLAATPRRYSTGEHLPGDAEPALRLSSDSRRARTTPARLPVRSCSRRGGGELPVSAVLFESREPAVSLGSPRIDSSRDAGRVRWPPRGFLAMPFEFQQTRAIPPGLTHPYARAALQSLRGLGAPGVLVEGGARSVALR